MLVQCITKGLLLEMSWDMSRLLFQAGLLMRRAATVKLTALGYNVKLGVWFADLLCVRPFREYTMGTGILLKKGSELGNTFRGWADFQLTDNIIAKTHIGHFSKLAFPH